MDVPSEEPVGRVLVVDDETASRAPVGEFLRELGFDVRLAADGFKALGKLEEWSPDVLLTDLSMPGMDGVTLLKKAKERVPDLGVILMTANATVDNAVEAMREGADDYLTKPVLLEDLELRLNKVLNHRELAKDAARMRTLLEGASSRGDARLIGEARSFREVVDFARQVADSSVPVAITGKTGTGKRSLARSIHQWSGRADAPLVSVDCAGANDATVVELLDDALARAEGATLLLLGVDTLPAAGQSRLLTAIEGRDESSARLIATATPDLRSAVDEGGFREDLAYRLAVVTLRLPALRERQEDIPLLAAHFAREHADRHNRARLAPSERTTGILLAYGWPGNVAQLRSCIEHAVVATRGTAIEPRDLPQELLDEESEQETTPPIPGSTLDELEHYAIMKTLEHVGGSTSAAARMLGISVRKVQYRLSQWRDQKGAKGDASEN